jgi:hypothetical protein
LGATKLKEKKMNAKKMFFVVLLLVAVLAISGCTKSATTPPPPTPVTVIHTVEVPGPERIVEVVVTPTPALAEPTLQVEVAKVEETRAASEADALVFTADGPHPVLHHADSHPPEAGVGSFDIGVNEGQVGLVFGVHVFWPAGSLDAGGDGCDLVILDPGFYPDLAIEDARYEVYTLPERDHDGWITSLATLRMEEQAAHYEGPSTMDHVQVWSADPHMESWASRRRASGVDYVIPFFKGDMVYGFSIYDVVPEYTEGVGHSPEPVCDGGGCYLASAPYDGACGGCVVNSWWDEIPTNPAQPLDPTLP